MDTVLHLSIVVGDLDEARAFYVDTLGCRPGRTHPDWMDVWFFGLQLTLHVQPEYVLPLADQGNRHFGVTIDASRFEVLVARLEARARRHMGGAGGHRLRRHPRASRPSASWPIRVETSSS